MDKNKGQQFLCENMIVLYVVSDWSHVSRLDDPDSLPIVDFNMSKSKIKRPNQKITKSILSVK